MKPMVPVRSLCLLLALLGGVVLLAVVNSPGAAPPSRPAFNLPVLVLQGSAHERGLLHGRTLKKQIHELVKLWKEDLAVRFKTNADTFIRRFVEQTDFPAAMKRWTPGLLDEIKGIAEGAGLDFDTLLVFQFMDEYLVNGEAVAAEHCSSLGWSRRGRQPSHLAQNMDLEGFRNGFQVLLHIKFPGTDLETVVLSNPGMIGWNGMNNKGIGICCNTLVQLRNCRDGLPVNCVVRGVLEQRSEEDAIQFLQRVKHASGQNYIVGGRRSVYAFECSAGKVTPFTPDAKRGVVWHTNHPLVNDDYTAKYREQLKKKPRPDSSSTRLRCLETRLKGSPLLDMDLIRTTLASRDSSDYPVSRPFKTRKDNFTFASTIMVLGEQPELHVAPGPPDRTPFQTFSFARAARVAGKGAAGGEIQREKLFLAGWDPDEPVPAYAYYKKGNRAMPVVIFLHGLGGSKEQHGDRMRDLAGKGFFVLAIDAHLHGERKVPGIFAPGKNLGNLGEDYSIWVHQSAVSHTARDVSRIIDALSARSDVDLARIGVIGISMGSSTCMVLAWKEPRISVIVGLIGAVDFWYDVTKIPPGAAQDAKRRSLSPRVRQLVSSLDPRDRKTAIAPKALFLANGARDKGIDIHSIRTFVKDLRPSYKDHPDRLAVLEEAEVGHSVTDRMWSEGTRWLVRHLVEKPIRSR